MIEYGLSVSLSPRTPMGQSSPMDCGGDGGRCDAPRKYMKFGESVSPRVDVAMAVRCLDFSSPPLDNTELSPVSFASASAVSASDGVGDCCVCYTDLPLRSNHVFTLCGHLFCVRCLLKWWDTNTTCPICRAELFHHEVVPAAAVEAAVEEAVEAVEAAVEAGAGAGAGAVEAEIDDNDGIWLQMRQEHWNNRYDGGMVSSDSDTESESAIDSP